MGKEKIVLVGGGGHAKVIIDAIQNSEEFSIHGIVDPSLPQGSGVLNVEVLGGDEKLESLFKEGIINAFISIGSVGNYETRKKIYHNLKNIGFRLPVIIHSKAIVSKHVLLGEGSFVAAGAVINPGVKTGKNVIINTSSSIDHDCEIEDFVHIAPGAILSGGVKIGEGTHIGIGANIVQYIKIGKNCMIKSGELVKKNII